MAVIFVSGFMLDADLWRDVELGLSDFGPIQHADLSLDNTLTAMAERALRDVQSPFILIGFSMGGYVAREMVRLAPERVSGLVLVATSARFWILTSSRKDWPPRWPRRQNGGPPQRRLRRWRNPRRRPLVGEDAVSVAISYSAHCFGCGARASDAPNVSPRGTGDPPGAAGT
jgi:pimeloyl-ACP methyl ester carboxylesterase